jgi:RNA polymerase sigma factor for flagellar operon FliA
MQGSVTAQLVVDHLPLAAAIARNATKRLPRHPAGFVDAEDLCQEARIGLLHAAARYDPGKAVPFGAYACRRIAGAIGDALRSNDHLTRDARAKLKASGQEDYGAPFPLLEPERLRSTGPWPDRKAAHAESRRLLNAALSTLPARLRVLVHSYYQDGKTMREIGLQLGVNESRISQLHAGALCTLRQYFRLRGISSEAFQ